MIIASYSSVNQNDNNSFHEISFYKNKIIMFMIKVPINNDNNKDKFSQSVARS